MIKRFSNKVAQDIYNELNSRYSRTLPKKLHHKAYRLLELIAITLVETLQIPPSNPLEKLRRELKKFWSIRINKLMESYVQRENGRRSRY